MKRPEPATDEQTARNRIRDLLLAETLGVRELSQRAHVSEKEAAEHLAHLGLSATARGERLVIEPSRCLSCGFTFEDRTRTTRPGKCPQCRATRIAPPRFRIEVG